MNSENSVVEVMQDAVVIPAGSVELNEVVSTVGDSPMYTSWLESIRSYLKDYPSWVVDIGVFGFGALLIGFLCKAFGRFVVSGIVIGVLVLVALQYLDFVQLNTQNLKSFFGFASAYSIHDVVMICVEWVKQNTVASVSALVGFLIGWKLA